MKFVVENKTELDLSIADFQGLNCKKFLPSLKTDRLQEKGLADLVKVSINLIMEDSIQFNIELFRNVENGQSLRVANFGGRKMEYSKEKIKETVCRFVNK